MIFVSCEFVFLNDGYDDCCDWSVFDKNKGISGIVWSRVVYDLENGRLVVRKVLIFLKILSISICSLWGRILLVDELFIIMVWLMSSYIYSI